MQDLDRDIPCIYLSATADGSIIEANETICQLLDTNRDELTGRKLESIFTLATRIFYQTHLFPLLQLKGQAEEIYITLKTKTGDELPLLLNAARREKHGQTCLQFAGISVSKRKKFEDEIIAAKKAAEKALKENITLKAVQEELQKRAEELDTQVSLAALRNQELKQFNHLTTHTFQEPLRKLMFFSSQIMDTEEINKAGATARKIRKAAEDMNAKLKGLQKYVWLTDEQSGWEEVDLRQVTDLAKKEVEMEHPGICITLHCEGMPAIEANREQMLFLMKELLANTVRFRKPGNVANVRIDGSTLLLNKFRHLPGKYRYTEFVKLQIEDSGIGFDNDYSEQAFELFGRLHVTSGNGIGLSLCKKIAENHGGSISINSTPDVGTSVAIFLPFKQEKALS